jgi:hypothetical protein
VPLLPIHGHINHLKKINFISLFIKNKPLFKQKTARKREPQKQISAILTQPEALKKDRLAAAGDQAGQMTKNRALGSRNFSPFGFSR